jgi:hypothetical protein
MSEIVLSRLKMQISAHCNEFSQNWWFFAISRNSGGFAYFPHKCGGFLELTLLGTSLIGRPSSPTLASSPAIPYGTDARALCALLRSFHGNSTCGE